MSPYVNAYDCSIGDDVRVGPYVEIQRGVSIGARSKIQSHSFLCEGVTLDEGVFIGHGVMFTNDRYPRATNRDGSLRVDGEWNCEPTHVRARATIGSNATLLCGIEIGEEAIVAAGAVVVESVPARTIVAGNPARVIRALRADEE